MRSVINIRFVKVRSVKITKELETSNLVHSTDVTMNKLCNAIKKHFKENNIEVDIDYEIRKS